MNPYLFLSALRARFGVFALLLAVTVLAASAVSLMLPKTYTATVSLLMDAKDEQSLSLALRPLILPQERMNYMQTQMDVITSQKVARKVVHDLKLAESPTARAAFEDDAGGVGSIEDWLGENLLKKLKVETSQSSIIQVSYSSRDPQFSAAVANLFSKAYIDTMLELRVEPTRQAAEWFDEQLKSLRANLEDAQAKLTDYHRRQGIVSADEHVDVENTRLGELSAQVGRAQEQTLQWQTREQQARDVLEQGRSPDRLPEVLDNPFIQKLKADLLHGEAKLQELATQYGANHPQYQSQFSENHSLREKLDAEMKKIVAGIESSTRQSRRREAETRKAMAAQRARVLDLKENRNELTVLKRNVDSAERAYDTAMQRFVVSQVESRASQTNVTLLNPAVVPRQPSSPRVRLNIALSVVVGTMLGVGMVMLMEMFDRRVRSRSDLELDVPLLAVLNAWQPAGNHLLGRSGGPRPALPSPR
ncbi:MAG TPA: chain length determinant protein EpsF [Burkholderiales bacterium]|jgi:chain length determinant protein EpsF|nr:chain length determinant protein EpsF [Burkholderiales bacterium]